MLNQMKINSNEISSVLCGSIGVGVGLLGVLIYRNLSCCQKKSKIMVNMTAQEHNSVFKPYDSSHEDSLDPDMNLIDNSNPNLIRCYDPSTGILLGTVKNMGTLDVEELIFKAKVAQNSETWQSVSFEKRRDLMKLLLDYYTDKENQLLICAMSSRDSGKTMFDAFLGEILPTCEKLRWIIANGEKYLQTERRYRNGLLTLHKKAMVEYHPVGVLAVIAPFNYPAHNLLNHIISGLFAKNAVVVKVSEYTSFSADFLVRPVKEALKALGFPEDLVQVVTGMAPAGKALVESKDIGKIIFTGSDKIGTLVMQSASKNLTPLVLELGGKDPLIICNDSFKTKSNIERILQIAMRGVFQNNGQNCIGIERIFVEEASYLLFLEKVEPLVKKLRQGVPNVKHVGETIDLGSLTVKSHLKTLKDLVEDAVLNGATLHCGGEVNKELLPGAFFLPTLLSNVTPEMKIFRQEVFGPIMVVMKWSCEKELLEMVNNCDYGLASSVFCKDYERANRIAKGIESGMTNINDFGVNYLCQSLPFGGVKRSGFDKFAGVEGLRGCCVVKSVTADRFRFMQTSLPKAFSYPISHNATEIASNLVGFAYAKNFLGLLTSLLSLILPISNLY